MSYKQLLDGIEWPGFTQYAPSIENILLTAYEHALEDYTNGLLKERGDGE